MRDKLKGAIIAVAMIAALAFGGAASAGATGGGDDDATDKPITGSALDRARTVALQHTGGGRVTGTEVNDEEGAYEVEVSDEGAGFAPEFAERAFERFARGDLGRTREGTGLGLSIVRAIAEAHGGRAEVAPDARATVRLWLPETTSGSSQVAGVASSIAGS